MYEKRMQSEIFSILVIATFSMGFLVLSNVQMTWAEPLAEYKIDFKSYYKYQDVGEVPHVDGFIGKNTCKQLGGKFLIGKIDALPEPVVALCEFHNFYFKLQEDEGLICGDDEGEWEDPKTGEILEVASCSPPLSCNAPGSSGIYANNSEYADEVNNTVPISADGKEFEIKIRTNSSVGCSNLTFDQEEKKISINSKGEGHGVTAVTIPNNLLGGKFSVYVNGNNTGFLINKTADYSIIKIETDYPPDTNLSDVGQTMDIIGTTVVPEFPYLGVTVFGIALTFVICTRLTKKMGMRSNYSF